VPVLKAEADERAARLALLALTAQTLRHGLSLLGIEVPERM
jgi:arginyl-tRNA synthetase